VVVEEPPELGLEQLVAVTPVAAVLATTTPEGDKSLILLVRLPLAMLLWVELELELELELEYNPSISISLTKLKQPK